MSINRRTFPWLLAAGLAAAAAWGLNRWLAPPAEVEPSLAASAAVQVGTPVPTELAADPPGLRKPIDLMGQTMDAARLFEIGYAGGLTLDGRTRDILEVLLSELPQEPSPDDLQRLEWSLRDGLPAADANQAIALFHGYRAYLKDMRGEYLRLGIPASREEADAFFAQMQALQRRHFGDEVAEAVFGEEMRHSRLVMEAGLVAHDATLSDQERQARLMALRSQLPPALQDAIPEAAASPASSP